MPESGGSPVVGETAEWNMDWLYRNVSLLPFEVLAELAKGPRHGWDCTVCRVLKSHPDNDSPWGRLTRWHQEPVEIFLFGEDRQLQDPARCGAIYGIAKVLVEAEQNSRSRGYDLAQSPTGGKAA